MKCFITGSTGFIGTNLLGYNKSKLLYFRCATRNYSLAGNKHYILSPDLKSQADWRKHIKGCDIVVHLAGRTTNPMWAPKNRSIESEYVKVNIEGTTILAKQACEMGVKQFIFVSSVGALREKSELPLPIDSAAIPQTPYGKSKLEAENILKQISSESTMHYTIIRPPLVYGFGNPGNIAQLVKLISLGLPLPLNALKSNLRSFVGVTNLVDLILLCIGNSNAYNRTFHVSDDDDISTAELILRLSKAYGKKIINMPLNEWTLKKVFLLSGHKNLISKLFDSLRIDITETKKLLGWRPKKTMQDELYNLYTRSNMGKYS